MHPNVYNGILNNSQNYRRSSNVHWLIKDKENGAYIHNGILLGNQKEWSLAICNDVDGARVYYARWNKLGRERQIPYAFTHMWNLRNKTDEHRREKKERGKS